MKKKFAWVPKKLFQRGCSGVKSWKVGSCSTWNCGGEHNLLGKKKTSLIVQQKHLNLFMKAE